MGVEGDVSSVPGRRGRWTVVALLVLALSASLGRYALFGDVGINLADEGFLWLGVREVLAGAVPLRDFQSYEPGRYLVGALFGGGLLDVRLAAAVFFGLGLAAGLLVLARVLPLVLLPVAAFVLCAWAIPRHKLFEPALALAGVFAIVSLLERPSARRHLLVGVFAGVAACFGRNHGLYNVLAQLCAGLYAYACLNRTDPLRKLAAWSGGIALGYAPMLLALVFVDGFAAALARSIAFYAEQGSNQPLPYPWPWSFGYGHLLAHERLAWLVAFALPPLLLPLAGLVGARWGCRRPARTSFETENPAPAATQDAERRGALGRVLFACGLVGLFYSHQYGVRSDAPHLAQGLHPVLLAAFVLPCALRSGLARNLAVALAFSGLVALAVAGPPAIETSYASMRIGSEAPAPDRAPFTFRAGEDEIQADFVSADYTQGMCRLLEHFVRPDATLAVLPGFPAFYPLLGRRPPVWWSYVLWRLNEEQQASLLGDFDRNRVDFVLVIDSAITSELLLRNTAPRVWERLETDFRRIAQRALPPGHHLFQRIR